MKQLLSQKEFISEISKRSNFTKSDVSLILSTIVEIFEDLVYENKDAFENVDDNVRSLTLLRVRDFGKLVMQRLKARTVTRGENAGSIYPATTRITFKLPAKIRGGDKFDDKEDF